MLLVEGLVLNALGTTLMIMVPRTQICLICEARACVRLISCKKLKNKMLLDADGVVAWQRSRLGYDCGCAEEVEPISYSRQNKRVRAQLSSGGFGGSTAVVPASAGASGSSFYRNLGFLGGTAFGGPVSAGVLSGLGSALDAAGGLTGAYKGMKSLVGWGDYSLRSNSLINGGGTAGANVRIVPQGNRAVRIVYREYIGDVFTHPTVAGAFNISAYPLNPGLLQTFKWLPPIAQQYEQWTPNGIVFEFKSTSSEYVATQALGSVIMATEYDSLDQPYQDKVEMLNCAYSNEGKPSEHILHGIECDPRDNPNSIFYVRNGLPDGDIRDYDLGTFYVATQGGATAGLNLGSLYIHYDITFRKEQLYNGIPLRSQLFAGGSLGNGVSTVDPFSGMTVNKGNFTPTFTSSTFSFPSYMVGSCWQFNYYLQGSPQNSPPQNIQVSGLVGLVNGSGFDTVVPVPGEPSPAVGRVSATFVFRQTAAVARFTITFTSGYSSGKQGWWSCFQLNNEVLPLS